MASAEYKDTLKVDRARLFKAITQYEDYPKFVEGCSSVQVERPGTGRARVSYRVSLMKEVTYRLDHVEDEAAGTMTWQLVDSDFMKKNIGSWKLSDAAPGQTAVTYEVEIEFKVPVPGLILNRLVKSSLPAMVKSFERRAQAL